MKLMLDGEVFKVPDLVIRQIFATNPLSAQYRVLSDVSVIEVTKADFLTL
jgi:hypothetical protein